MAARRLWPMATLPHLVLLCPALAAPAAPGGGQTAVCASCHRDKWETYRRTGMGRSFYRPAPQNMVEDFNSGNTYYHGPSESWFTMLQRGGEYFQRRHQLDSLGREVNVVEKRIDFVMGSGNHARAYLHRTPAGEIVELPLGWYAEKGGSYAMSPGYDRADHDGFRRRISYDCMFCHNAYPLIPAGHDQPLARPVYSDPLPEGIDCQRCHGSGARHMSLASSGAGRAQVRAAIVNPARLSPEHQMEICMVCHLEPTSFPLPNALLRYNRGPFFFRPGEPMGDYLLTFDHAPGTGRDDKFEIVNAAYRLRRSACFLRSGGKLLCTTCHNPHDIPRGAAAALHYDRACRQCHAATSAHNQQQDCAACHMPKRRTEDVVHSLATDHLIQRRRPAGDLLAERAERHETGALAYRGRVVLYYPGALPPIPENELYLAAAQVKQNSNLAAGVAQLATAIEKHRPQRAEFYLDLAEALERSGRLKEALPVYRAAASRNPKFAPALQRLGSALRRSGQNAESVAMLERAAALGPNDARTWHELGQSYRVLGRSGDARAAIGKAVERDPELPEAHNNLGVLWLAQGATARAEAAFREAVRIRPDYADARSNLANLLAGARRFVEAREHFEAALRRRPGDAATRYRYAMLLGRTGHYDSARRELEDVLRADPDFADAHLALGAALASSGDAAGAAAHLRQAEAGGDAAIRRQAAELLRRLKPAP